MTNGGSIISMTYYGSTKVVPHYNVMGVAKASLEATTRYLAFDLGPKKIRVNCISAGPVATLAARGIAGFSSMLKHYQEHAPLQRSWIQLNSAIPEFFWQVTVPLRLPARSFTSMAGTRLWGCKIAHQTMPSAAIPPENGPLPGTRFPSRFRNNLSGLGQAGRK